MEKNYISKMNQDMLLNIGLTKNDIINIENFINIAIQNNLYTNTPNFQYDLKHIERVLIYCSLITNKMRSNGENIDSTPLMIAALYHDIDKNSKINKQELWQRTNDILDEKTVHIIQSIIGANSNETGEVNINLSPDEKYIIQKMADILNDADALDINRLNYPPPIGTCNIEQLKTKEAKEIYKFTDLVYYQYMATIIKEKELKTGNRIFNNYEKLEEWLRDFNNGSNNLYHASLDPSIEELFPKESTQSGRYVYAAKNPISCTKMAIFRSSAIFPRKEHDIQEIYPDSIVKTLGNKIITIYRVNQDNFTEYKKEVTSAPSGEWVSTNKEKPIEQISFNCIDYLNYIQNKNLLKIVKDYSLEKRLHTILKSLETYIWNLKKMENDPLAFKKSKDMLDETIKYYLPNDQRMLDIVDAVRAKIDEDISNFITNHVKENGVKPDFNDEKNTLKPLIENYKKWCSNMFIKENGETKINDQFIDALLRERARNKKIEELTSLKEDAIAYQALKQNMLNQPDNKPNKQKGVINSIALPVITLFASIVLFTILYLVSKY